MNIAEVADELYGLPPEDFVAVRTAREKEAKTAGDRDLAREIHALTKPNQVAWLANQLSRQHDDEVAPLVELGATLRDAAATLTSEQLRGFTQQRRQLVGALLQQARRLAGTAGRPVSDDTARGLQATLEAALADPEAAALLREGRLSRGLEYSGFGPVPAGGTVTVKAAPARGGGAASAQRRTEQITAADRDLEDARAAVAEAEQTKAEAEADVTRSDDAYRSAEEEQSRLRELLTRADAELAEADWSRRRARKELERAERAAAHAERRAREAAERRRSLGDPDPE